MRPVTSILFAVVLAACVGQERTPQSEAPPAPGTPEWKVQSARSGGPAEISGLATVIDWPAEGDTTGNMPVLAQGSNGWTCVPDFPGSPLDDPGCADSVAVRFYDSLMAGRPPAVRVMGLVYGPKGGQLASLTNPALMAPDSGTDWITLPPYIGVIMPDPRRSFSGLPTAPPAAGPWVAFAGTPYAMLIVPTGSR